MTPTAPRRPNRRLTNPTLAICLGLFFWSANTAHADIFSGGYKWTKKQLTTGANTINDKVIKPTGDCIGNVEGCANDVKNEIDKAITEAMKGELADKARDAWRSLGLE